MKQSFAFAAFASLLLSMNATSSNAQEWASTRVNPSLLASSSRTLIASEESDRKAMASIKDMSTRMFMDFTKSYQNARNIRTDLLNNLVYVSFDDKNVRTRVCYSKNGRWQSTIKYFEADQLPADIVNAVNDYYPRYEITRGQQVSVASKTAWLVNIESKTGYKTIRLLDGEMDIFQEYQKQK